MLAAHGCGDNPSYKVDCELHKHLCHKLPKMQKCVDLSDKCSKAGLDACLRPPDDKPEENPYYKPMSRVCRKTCNLCDEPFDEDISESIEEDNEIKNIKE
ncbi:hypothetical protein Mgra_00008980 [Meloidogyne graminicola]|uniref:ShKT domain-containing protein n=1 Tax=Meloidogyne graminicola TaxID=189291 RepID=A0A8S9ZE87_9BILA|nr:hypothetical protein Mgra_00008980 [Meloidogyne graminicola]